MQTKSKQKLFTVKVVLESGKTREVNVKASTQTAANRRALKHTKGAVAIHTNP